MFIDYQILVFPHTVEFFREKTTSFPKFPFILTVVQSPHLLTPLPNARLFCQLQRSQYSMANEVMNGLFQYRPVTTSPSCCPHSPWKPVDIWYRRYSISRWLVPSWFQHQVRHVTLVVLAQKACMVTSVKNRKWNLPMALIINCLFI